MCSIIAAIGLFVGGMGAQQVCAANGTTELSVQAEATSTLATVSTAVMGHRHIRADFGREHATKNARHVADWVVASGDNLGMPFMIVDKIDARVFAFNADGRLRGTTPVLLGLARGDDAVPGIGNRPLSSIRPEERTTPAGRFVAELGRNARGVEILWVDYDGAVSLHPVVSSKAEERRLQRLASPTPLDNRISYGCINVPAQFFQSVVRPTFAGTYGIVYVLPEIGSAQQVFGSYDVANRTPTTTLSPAENPVPPAPTFTHAR